MSGLLDAAYQGDIARMKQLLAEGASITEKTAYGMGVVLMAASGGSLTALTWILTEGGASVKEHQVGNEERTVWKCLRVVKADDTKLSSLLKVIVMLEDAPAAFLARLMTHHAQLCGRGRYLRAQLPSYLEKQRSTIVIYCPVPAVLQSIVAEYATTTPEDMWTYGLFV
jgi:hypothetical protein